MKDFVFLNVKDLWERKFWRTDEAFGLVPDLAATEFNRTRLRTQLEFMFDAGLVAIPRPSEHALMECMIRFSDLTDLGQRFVVDKGFEKWFRRMDKNPEKYPPGDASFLRSELAKILKT